VNITLSSPELDWSALNTEWEKSKESQSAFCIRKNLNLNTFTYWRAKFISKRIKSKSASPFIPVKIKPEPISISAPIIIENQLGLKMIIPTSLDTKQLTQLLNLLGFTHAEN